MSLLLPRIKNIRTKMKVLESGFALPIAIFANCDIFLNLAIENKNWRKKMATTKNDLKSPSPA